MELNNKVAVVTGAAQGIGKVIAMLLAGKGASLVVCDINLDMANETANEIEVAGGKCLALKSDVTSVQDAEKIIKETVEHCGSVDILVNNAGITKDNVLLRMKEDQWDQVMAVNLKGTFNVTKAAIKVMMRKKSGKIINIASITGLMGNAGQANYSASKAGVIGFTKAVAREYAERGITVNAVAPGFIETAMTDAIPEREREELIKQIPIKKLGTPEDVANAVCFLASEEANYITGQVIGVNGGLYM
ncbi:MAG: 3-oxoacyl-[acyl-carrier-protein] reductase [Deltaproteobacteria bacterium]|jgi:3-oxoacyl-[acyl-carrier protein] reductase|nr:3-oxoacyl-[acyl-carrier-protein] reductase [Deltaproteobacteria bacterium]